MRNQDVRIAAKTSLHVFTSQAEEIDSKRSSTSLCLLARTLNFDRATVHNQDMVVLLRDLRDQVSEASKSRIDDLLASVSSKLGSLTGD